MLPVNFIANIADDLIRIIHFTTKNIRYDFSHTWVARNFLQWKEPKFNQLDVISAQHRRIFVGYVLEGERIVDTIW